MAVKEDNTVITITREELRGLIEETINEMKEKEDEINDFLDEFTELDDDETEDNNKENLDDDEKENKPISRTTATYYQYQVLYLNIIGLLVISVILLISGPFVQPLYFVYVDIYMFLTAIFMLPIPALRWNFLLYYCIVACAFFFVKNMAILVLDFGNFINCKSSQCSTIAKFTFYMIYYIFSIITVFLMLYFVKLMYYILYTKKFEDNINNSYDDGSKKIEIPQELKKKE